MASLQNNPIATPVSPTNNPIPVQQATLDIVPVINPAQITGFNQLYNHVGAPNSIWTDYRIFSHYERDEHVYMGGVTSPNGNPSGDTCSFVQLAMPTLLLVVDWTVAKFNEPPEIPNYDLSGTALSAGGGTAPVSPWVLLDDHYNPVNFLLTGGGPNGPAPLYRISGTYVYGHRKPNAVATSDIVFPRPAWMPAAPITGNTIPVGKLVNGLFT